MTQHFFTRYLFVLFAAIILIHACKRDNNTDMNPSAQVDDLTQVQAGISGIVINEKGQPVEGAQVKCGNSTTTTDRYGAFQFNNISLSKNNGFVRVEKTGYFRAYRNFVTSPGTMNQVRIRLLPRGVNGNFSANTGGSVNLSDGAKLTIPANAITDASGNAYTGNVSVSMTWINPADPNLPDMVMGDLRGITIGGEERGLETFGMIGVELKGNAGEDLKIKPGQKADLVFPIPVAMRSNAPATIDLWHYDETKARWMQEGSANKSSDNNSYVAQVTHFSFWNCDAPFPLVEFCAKLVDELTGQPLNNVGLRITRSNGSAGYGRTDTAGNICGKIPRNEPLSLQILNQCNESSASFSIGPFSSNTSIGIIKVTTPSANRVLFSGTVKDCNNAPVTNGFVRIYAGNGQVYTANVNNGNYQLAVIKCNNEPVTYSATAVDLNSLQQNIPVTVSVTSGSVNVPEIQSCGTSSLQFIEILIDGAPYNIVAPPDRISISDTGTAIANFVNDCFISGGKSNNPGSTSSNNINFVFKHNRAAANGIPLNRCFVFISQLLFSEQILTPNPTINLTKYGSTPGSVVEGNFEISMSFQGTPRTVRCTFRIIKP